jgi:DNA-binding NarL/FixJ family response regulator
VNRVDFDARPVITQIAAVVRGETAPPVDLTPQELAIATLIAQGKSNKEVATAVYLSPKTVEYHLANTFRKLSIHSRVELARLMLLPDGE